MKIDSFTCFRRISAPESHIKRWTNKIKAPKKMKDNGRNARKKTQKTLKQSKNDMFRSYARRGKLTYTYSPSLITPWKNLLVKAKVKTMQYHDYLAACFDNKLNFMKWKSNYLKVLHKKINLMRYITLLNNEEIY